MAQPVKVGIVSIGEMGVGIAKLLAAHGYFVLTNITGRRIGRSSQLQALGIYDELQGFLKHFQPALQETTSRMVTEIPPKAGRWVDEMLEIGRCFGEEGGWNKVTGTEAANIYQRVAELYRTIADDTLLGQERQEHRVRGNTAGDIALAVEESLNPNYKK
ncbi:6-phosphogluconate dehydrogenase C-terminal domain-like protein [Penicillium malachiteum]|uniref:6-phosphogluconate dehydrogenase C-terminal domain-like protein n=1 Tax=Penicillium malachiteum TaxID=1324776 RepID=A0AAD6MQI3_9EURO|nr:6-phosphogluconate dehydrogenase C-terminal domain-like protein [Penicillium malachiteum]